MCLTKKKAIRLHDYLFRVSTFFVHSTEKIRKISHAKLYASGLKICHLMLLLIDLRGQKLLLGFRGQKSRLIVHSKEKLRKILIEIY